MINLEHGLDERGLLVHVSKSARGLGCNLKCPSCKEPLVAAKGEKMPHHFRHYSVEACSGSGETAIHLLTKAIIEERGWVFLKKYRQRGGSQYKLSDIQSEAWEGDYRPDITATLDNGEKIYIEIKVTHAVDKRKLDKLKRDDVLSVEVSIDKRKATNENIRQLISDSIEFRQKWLHVPDSSRFMQEYIRYADMLRKEREREEIERIEHEAQNKRDRLYGNRNVEKRRLIESYVKRTEQYIVSTITENLPQSSFRSGYMRKALAKCRKMFGDVGMSPQSVDLDGISIDGINSRCGLVERRIRSGLTIDFVKSLGGKLSM